MKRSHLRLFSHLPPSDSELRAIRILQIGGLIGATLFFAGIAFFLLREAQADEITRQHHLPIIRNGQVIR